MPDHEYRPEVEHQALLQEVFIAVHSDLIRRLGEDVTPPPRAEVDVEIGRQVEEGQLWLVVKAFQYETVLGWTGSLGDAIDLVSRTAETRAYDFDQ